MSRPGVLDLRIPSRTTPGLDYEVRVTARDVSCECISYRMRRRCAHVRLGRLIFDDAVGAALMLARLLADERIAARADRTAARQALRSIRSA